MVILKVGEISIFLIDFLGKRGINLTKIFQAKIELTVFTSHDILV
jgi:hypothetical protein